MIKKQVVRILGLAGFLFVLATPVPVFSQANITKIKFPDRPRVEVTNVNYIGNRKPLQPLHFIKLPVTAVKPEG